MGCLFGSLLGVPLGFALAAGLVILWLSHWKK